MGFFAQAHVCSDSIYFGQPSVIVYIVNIIVNDTKIIIFQQCFLSFLCKSGRKTDKAKLYIQSTINTDYLLWQKSTVYSQNWQFSHFYVHHFFSADITMHRGAFCQFPFRWIYYCHSSKFTRKETGKMYRSSNFVYVLHVEIWGKNQRQQKDKIHLRLILLGIYNFGTKEEKYRAKIIGVFNHAQFGVIRNAIKKWLLRSCL